MLTASTVLHKNYAMARTDPQVNIRLPATLKAQLEESATKAGRSLTAEIVHRLEDSLDLDKIEPLDDDLYADKIRELDQRYANIEEMQNELRKLIDAKAKGR